MPYETHDTTANASLRRIGDVPIDAFLETPMVMASRRLQRAVALVVVAATTAFITSAAAADADDLGFETPQVQTIEYNPLGSIWSFDLWSGILAPQSFVGDSPAPQGRQVAFISGWGDIQAWVDVHSVRGSVCTLRFRAAQHADGNRVSRQDFIVLGNGSRIGSFSPSGTSYQEFVTDSFIAGSNHVLIEFVGINSAGGGYQTVLIDDVHIDVKPPDVGGDLGFERPVTSSYVYRPDSWFWSFNGASGISTNNTAFTSGNPAAPQGRQVAFLQNDGRFSARVPGVQAGVQYVVHVKAAQRGNWSRGRQDFRIEIDGGASGYTYVRPYGTGYDEFTTAAFTATGDSFMLEFVGLNSEGGDHTVFLDDVRIEAVWYPPWLLIGDQPPLADG